MQLDLGGHPLHTRHLTVDLAMRDDGLLDARAEIVDLRKRAFVPVNGDLQPAGVVHHMQLFGAVDPVTRRLRSLEAVQPTVAFEPAEIADGESCRDPIRRIERLAGVVVDRGFSRAATAEIGGPRGCSHILTLSRLLGSTISQALEYVESGVGGSRDPAQRIFRRDLSIDGSEVEVGVVQLALQLTDLFTAPTTGIVRPMERFAAGLEVRALVQVDMAETAISDIAAAERRRDSGNLATADWCRRDDVAPLVGRRLVAGFGGELVRCFGSRDADRPLLDTLLNLTPALHQCMAVLNEGWIHSEEITATHVGMGGPPDSCYMWRNGGPLDRRRRESAGDG